MSEYAVEITRVAIIRVEAESEEEAVANALTRDAQQITNVQAFLVLP
jgi:flavin-binding protein dodecin